MKNKLIKNFVIIFIITILAKISSFFAEIIVAAILGTTAKADAFSMISGVHQVIYPMLSVGIWSLFLPEYKKILTKYSSEEADCLANKIVTLFTIFSFIISFLVCIFSKYIINFIAVGFSEQLKEMSTKLLQIYSPYFVFVIISSVYAAMLQAREKFVGSQIREVVSFLPTIFLGKILYSVFDVKGLVIALLLGSILRLVVLFPFINWKYKFKMDFKLKDAKILNILKKIPSVLASSGASQLNTLIDKMMASGLVVGSVSSLSYGNKLINVVNGLLTSAVSTAIYPTMSQLVIEERKEDFKNMFEKTLRLLVLVIVPLSVIVIFLRKVIVSIVFERGMFSSDSVVVTAKVFGFYAIGLYFIGIKSIFDHAFYSIGDTKSIMKVSLIGVAINIFLNLILVKLFGIIGLPLATSVSSIVSIIIAIIYMKKYMIIDIRKSIIYFLKIVIISLISIIISYYIIGMLNSKSNIICLIMCLIIFFTMYIIQLSIFKVSEYKQLIEIIKQVLKKIKNRKKEYK